MDWEAWDVVPKLVERRSADRRTRAARVPFAERRTGERRAALTRRAILGSGLDQGWLCFENEREKRRLAPIPAGWTDCCTDTLESYLRAARPVRRGPRVQ